MPRSGRRLVSPLFRVTAGVSLVLCLLFAAGWVRSRFATDSVSYNFAHRAVVIRSIDGTLEARFLWSAWSSTRRGWQYRSSPPQPKYTLYNTPTIWGMMGFYASWNSDAPRTALPSSEVEIGVPFWFLLLLAAVLPGIALAKRRGRALGSACPVCGYDLRATPDRCPECGTVPNNHSR